LPQWRGTFVFSDASADDPDAIPVEAVARGPLVARARGGGERMRCVVNGPSRTLKNLFQEGGVPSWKRDVPLLFVGGELLFVPLIGVNRAALAHDARQASSRYLRIEWREDLTLA
jgi:tRNA(Ile)-lysidine synthase